MSESFVCVRDVHVHERKNAISNTISSVILDHTHKSINIQLSLSIIRIHIIRQVLESYVTVKTVRRNRFWASVRGMSRMVS
jgi:hypothetical protein